MKGTTMKYITIFLFVLAISATTFAGELPKGAGKMENQKSNMNLELIELNVLSNFNSPIEEVRANTVQLIIDIKLQRPDTNLDYAVFPLMNALKTDSNEGVRILSAIALYYMNTEVGNFAIQQASKHDDSKRVQRQCKILIDRINEKASE